MIRPSCLLVLPLLAGCNWRMWYPFIDLDEAPAIHISSPSAGQAFETGDTPSLIAWVAAEGLPAASTENAEGENTEGAAQAPTLTFELIVDGTVQVPTVTASNFASITHPLPATEGPHQLTLTASDLNGNTGRAAVSYSVGDPTAQDDSDDSDDSDAADDTDG